MENISQDELTSWYSKLKYAEEHHEKRLKKPFEETKKFYEGDQWDKSYTDSFLKFTNNKVFANSKVNIAYLYYRDPKIIINYNNEVISPKLNTFVNNLYRGLDCKEEIRKIIQDTDLSNLGCIKLGYHSEFGYEEIKKEDNILSGLGFIDETGKIINQVSEKSEQQGYNEIIKEEFPFGVRVSPKNIIIDPDATPPYKDAMFLVHKMGRLYDDVKADTQYDQTVNLPIEYKTYAEEKEATKEDRPKELKVVTIYEIHYKKRVNGELQFWILTVVKGGEKPLKHKKSEYNFFPFEFLYFNTSPDETYSYSDVYHYKSLQILLNMLTSAILNQVLRSLSKLVVPKGVLEDDKTKNALTSEIIASVIEMPDPDKLKWLTAPPMGGDIYSLISMINGAINEISTTAPAQRGQVTKGTATEIGVVQSNLELRSSYKLEQVAGFITNIAKKILHIAFKFFPLEKYIEILKDEQDGKILFEFIEGKNRKLEDYEISIDLTSMIKMDDNVKLKLTLDIYNLFRGEGMLDRKKLITTVLKALKDLIPDFLEPEQYFLPEAISADAENIKIMNETIQGNHPQVFVQENENLEEHLQIHTEFTKQPIFGLMSPQGQQYLLMHIGETQNAIGIKQQQTMGTNTIQRTQGFPEGNKLATNLQSIPLTSNE